VFVIVQLIAGEGGKGQLQERGGGTKEFLWSMALVTLFCWTHVKPLQIFDKKKQQQIRRIEGWKELIEGLQA